MRVLVVAARMEGQLLARMRSLGSVPGGRLMGVDRKQRAAPPKGAHDPGRVETFFVPQ